MFTLYGSISLLLLILNLYSLEQLNFLSVNSLNSRELPYISWILLFISFAVKIPLFPFHSWLPYAHLEASTASSILLAALMLKLGGYGLIQFMIPLFNVNAHLFFRPLVYFLCLLGLIYGALSSLRQIDLKRQIAFSSIAHMSLALIGIFTLSDTGIKGAVYLMISHGLGSCLLFFLIGVLSDRYHTRSILVYSGLSAVMPIFSIFVFFANFVNISFPLTSGFLP
jgi:NADH:ubiquinone oxidoreductase subunit 4 (subunit M)